MAWIDTKRKLNLIKKDCLKRQFFYIERNRKEDLRISSMVLCYNAFKNRLEEYV